MNETLKTIEQRRSCRLFQNKSLSKEELEMILKAGIQAPSAMNKQLCEVFAITDPTLIDELAENIKNVYIERGEQRPSDYHFAYHAPVLVIVSGPEYDSCRLQDGSCILENMFLAATSLNIGSCWINQFKDTQNVDEVRSILTRIGIPVNHQIVGCAALGYPCGNSLPKEKNMNRIHII